MKYIKIAILLPVLITSACTSTKALLFEKDINKKITVVDITKNNKQVERVVINSQKSTNIKPQKPLVISKKPVVNIDDSIATNSDIVGEVIMLDNLQKVDVKILKRQKDNNNKTAIDEFTKIFYFDLNSSSLDKSSIDELVKQAKFMQQNPDIVLKIVGHTDERGSRSYNLALGENRALAIKDIISLYGVGERVNVISYGEEKPTSQEHNESAWGKNRRAELFY